MGRVFRRGLHGGGSKGCPRKGRVDLVVVGGPEGGLPEGRDVRVLNECVRCRREPLVPVAWENNDVPDGRGPDDRRRHGLAWGCTGTHRPPWEEGPSLVCTEHPVVGGADRSQSPAHKPLEHEKSRPLRRCPVVVLPSFRSVPPALWYSPFLYSLPEWNPGAPGSPGTIGRSGAEGTFFL